MRLLSAFVFPVIISVFPFFCVSCATASHAKPRRPAAASSGLAACIRDPECREPFIVDHRGFGFELLGAPENSRAAAMLAVNLVGIRFLETDVRLRNNTFYIFHDRTLDRTTNRHGDFYGVPLKTLRSARLTNGETIPTLSDIYALTKRKALIVLDMKNFSAADVERLGKWIAKNGSFDDFIFYVNSKEEIVGSAAVKKKYPRAIVMPQIDSSKEIAEVERAFRGLPDILELGLVPNESEIAWIHNHGAKAYANAHLLEWEFLFRLTYGALPEIFRESDADFIETDHPQFWAGHVLGLP